MTSEFGRGYATCLIQFAFHKARLSEYVDDYREMAKKYPEDGWADGRRAAEMWANGSSDHLYELKRPRRGVDAIDWKAAKSLQDRALDIGHGYRDSSRATPEECADLIAKAELLLDRIGVADFDAAFAWDTEHGLKPEAGDWACRVPMVRRK